MRERYPFEPVSAYIVGTSTNLFANYVKLVPGVPTRLHFTDDYDVKRTIADKETGKPKRIKSLVFWVDELDGKDTSTSFSILSEKLAAQLTPYLKDKRYDGYDFIITELGEGYLKDWNVQVIKRPEVQ